MASLSEKLRRERELRGISLKQISEETKIGVRFLEALEENRLELIPGEFYRRSYLRAYARHLGLDEDRAVNAYLYSRSEGRNEGDPGTPDAPSEGPQWPMWAVGVVLLVGAGFLLLRHGGGATEVTSPPQATSPSLAEDTPDSLAAGPAGEAVVPPAAVVGRPDTPLIAAASVAYPTAPLRLVLSVQEPCWLEIEADGVVVTTGLKEEGFRQALSAENEVRLWLGNAGGVSLWLNERPTKPLGREGQVRRDVTITPDNIAEFLTDSEDFS